MISAPLRSLAAGALLACTACVNTSYDQRARQMAHAQADQQMTEEELRRVQGRIDTFEMQLEEIHRQIDRLREDVRRAGTLQESALSLKLDAAEARIAQLEAARERDRREIVDQITERVSNVMAASAPAARTPATRTRAATSTAGYEHAVQSGQTLSHIAQAYGVSVQAIVDANNLKNPNDLRVGQKLFIPE